METTARFYLERMRAQVEQARRRQYPNSAEVHAKWLALVNGRLKSVEAQLNKLSLEPTHERDYEAESLLVEINGCYDDLQVLSHADTSEVADFVVRALHRRFRQADPESEYLFTSGINFELEPLFDGPPPETHHEDHDKAVEDLPPVLYRVTMPGGALGAALHIPLVTHELGHVLIYRYVRENGDDVFASLMAHLSSVRVPDEEQDVVRSTYEGWIAEIIADTVCGFVSGPAGFFALHEKLRGGGTPNSEYPDNHIRVSSLHTLIKDRFSRAFTSKHLVSADWTNWPVKTETGLFELTKTHEAYEPLSLRLIEQLPELRAKGVEIAKTYVPEFEYHQDRFLSDLDTYLESFQNAIPPIETPTHLLNREPADLMTILNVGWFIAAFGLAQLQITIPPGPMQKGQLLVCLDQLILKAIELSELRREWSRR